MYKAYLADATVNYIRTSLLKLICIDGQSANITMLNQHLCNFSIGSIVEKAIGIYTLFTIFKPCMAKNISRAVVLMIPYQRNFNTVIILKSISTNYSSV